MEISNIIFFWKPSLVALVKRVRSYLSEITICCGIEIVTCHGDRWMFSENVTISKQTFRFVLYPLGRIRGQQSGQLSQKNTSIRAL